MNKKTLKQRIIFGVKSGWSLEIYPKFLIDFDKQLKVRIFKYIGTVFTSILLSGIASNFNILIFYFMSIWSIIYILYRLSFVFFILFQFIVNVKNGKFIIKK